jgi:hypothetical protein
MEKYLEWWKKQRKAPTAARAEDVGCNNGETE